MTEPTLGLLVSAPVFEEVFGRLGLDRATYLRTYDNDWICYYARLLRARGFRLRWYLFSRDVARPETAVHEPTGSEVRFLPAARLYNRWTQRLPWVWRFRLYFATISRPLARELSERPPHLLWIQDYESGRFDVASVVAGRRGIPVVGQFHGGHSPARAPLARLRRRTLRQAALILAPNREEHRRVRDAYGLGERAMYFPNPVPMPPPLPPAAVDAVRKDLGLGELGRYVLFMGRIDANKRLGRLLDAFAHVAPVRPDVHLIVAGDGPDRRALEARGGVRVRFLGWVDDRARVHALQSAAALVACPSAEEAFCYVAAEAMTAGRAVVASAVGGLRDLVDHGRTGLLVPPGNVASLADAMGKLLDDPDLAREMGQAGRARIEREFSEAVLAPRLADLFGGVIARGRTR